MEGAPPSNSLATLKILLRPLLFPPFSCSKILERDFLKMFKKIILIITMAEEQEKGGNNNGLNRILRVAGAFGRWSSLHPCSAWIEHGVFVGGGFV